MDISFYVAPENTENHDCLQLAAPPARPCGHHDENLPPVIIVIALAGCQVELILLIIFHHSYSIFLAETPTLSNNSITMMTTTANSNGDATPSKANPWPKNNVDVVHSTTTAAASTTHQHFQERNSNKISRRHRASLDIVNETRSTPGKWIALILGAFCVVLGLRDIFFCGHFFEFEREVRQAVYGGDTCQEGPHKILVGLAGIGILFNGIQRISFALAKHVADLSYSATMVLTWDCLYLYIVLSVDEVPTHYIDLCYLNLIYQGYLTVMAWEALDRKSKPLLYK